jgi:dihydroorotase
MGDEPSGERLAYDTNCKVNPPLRTPSDVAACVAGLREGVIDCIATDHAPHASEDKLCEFGLAAFGISGFETAFALSHGLVVNGQLDLPTLIERLSAGPARVFGLDRMFNGLGSLVEGSPADIVLLDTDSAWVVDPNLFASKGKNTPLAGRTLQGRVRATIARGVVVWSELREAVAVG